MHRSLANFLDVWFSRLTTLALSRRRYLVTFKEVSLYLEESGIGDKGRFFPESASLDKEMAHLLQSGHGWHELPTLLPSGIPANDRICVRFYPAPDELQSRGGVFLLHGLMMNTDLFWRPVVRMFRHEGFDVFLPAAPFHFRRTPPGTEGGEYVVAAHFLRAVDTIRQGVTDLRGLLRSYRALTDKPVGVVGFSMGGLMGGWLDVLEQPDFSVLMVPALQVEPTFFDLELGRLWRRNFGRTDVGAHEEQVREWIRWMEPVSHPMKADPASVLLVVAEHDAIVRLPELQEGGVIRRWKGVKVERMPHGHVSMAFSLGAFSLAVNWAMERLRL